MDKINAIYQIFLDTGFNDNELSGDGMFAELLSTAQGLSQAYSPAWCVKLSIDEARGLLNRLERSAVLAARKEYEDETSNQSG